MTDEQTNTEVLATDSGGTSHALFWNGTSALGLRSGHNVHATLLPTETAFTETPTAHIAAHTVTIERVTEILRREIGGTAQSAGLPSFLRLEATGDINPPHPVYLASKRACDTMAAFTLLAALFPVLLFIGLSIVVEDRGPILYYQTRVGKNGRHFRFYKFRSMVRDADALKEKLAAHNESTGPAFKMKNDPRITRVGRILRKTSLDELPQLLNVLRGEMSLVGPRPHLPREVEQYQDWHHERQFGEPGLLCLREVLGRSNLTFDQWVAYDLLYIRNRSARTDVWVLLRLIPALLKADGAY